MSTDDNTQAAVPVAIQIIRAGKLNSVQDAGRSGFRHLGICQAGALDNVALSIANRLVGNVIDTAALEITMGPCVLRFATDTRIALGGADFAATLDDKPLAPWWSVQVRAGQTLTLNAARHGMRAYVAIAGGINVPKQLGSCSTDIQAGFGGHQGRPLQNDDQLVTGAAIDAIGQETQRLHAVPNFGVRPPGWYQNSDDDVVQIRVIPGPEYALFTAAAQKAFWSSQWTLTSQSNRMGFRLSGPELKTKKAVDLLSHGVLPGVIQVPPSGQPIVLMADAQTTGGYPKIGVVIQADLARLAQCRFNRTLQFVTCSIEQARQELNNDTLFLEQIAQAMTWLRPTNK
ncbi:5-oxoprolinase subunit C family protein [Glaciimonas soli]|uniref:5-oxoprolinase/urea amidolyase family protein n=1 Tax=Glaciimonas soli TaxID=2590999 RepID=A0A843YT47_9BURK|nr:biotin-dependent carboxyltransferase family protein [Glaciimonas soli]MQR00521.1 5-oxoprolinase/urea amidolyase family protein [Glaciimonas soli]